MTTPDSDGRSAELLARLPPALAALLALATATAAGQGTRLWLVGGVVRDLLLGLAPGRDIDLAVEGDAPALAAALAAAGGGHVLAAHATFGTATVVLPDPSGALRLLDLARTRVERYPRPAALPEVRPAPIEADLARRDYSVNALAMELIAAEAALVPGRLLDKLGGRADLAAGVLRLLHRESLRDDPTRMLRGARLAARLDLRPEPDTTAQIAGAVAAEYLGLLSAERILGELCLTLEEPRPDEALRTAEAWGVTPQIFPAARWGAALAERSARAAAGHDPPVTPLVWAGLLLYDLPAATLEAFGARYPLPGGAAALIRQLPALRALAPRLTPELPDSVLERLLRPVGPDAAAVLHYAEPDAAGPTARYLTTLRAVRAPLDGHDLRRLGVAPGPQIGQLLAELRAATLDGAVTTRDEAEAWVQARMREGRRL